MKRVSLFIIKSAKKKIISCALEFLISLKKSSSPEIRKLLINYESKYSKAKLCGKKRRRFTSKKELYTFILCGSAQMSSFCASKE